MNTAATPTPAIPQNWIRMCQECGFKQKAKPPNEDKELTDSYRDSKCRSCKSPALDFGKYASPSN